VKISRADRGKAMQSVILHDHFPIMGGGERLVLTLARGLGSDIVFGYSRSCSFPLDNLRGELIDLNVRITLPVIRLLTLSHAFQRFGSNLRRYPNRIYSGICAPLAALRAPSCGKNLFYCHTPPRHIYDKHDHFHARLPLPLRPVASAIYSQFKPDYEAAVAMMDIVVANSMTVQQRILRYLGIPSVVIYPPCETDRFRWLADDGYYLSTARHHHLKRVDKIISAFQRTPRKRLVVTSSGYETNRLRALAAGAANITFTGPVGDTALHELIGRARATVYIPEDEDFGMSPVESMAAGKPVIGVNEGGVRESVVDQSTGLLLPPDPSPDDIIAAVDYLDSTRSASMRHCCQHRAAQFSSLRFIAAMKELLDANFSTQQSALRHG
jgi:glycosyltransferase involved in cell wall biosynthesis